MPRRPHIPIRQHDLRAWFAETRRTKPPQQWQAEFARLMADWKRRGRLPTRDSTQRFCAWLAEQQRVALAARRTHVVGISTSSGATRLRATSAQSDELLEAAARMVLTGMGQVEIDARADEHQRDEPRQPVQAPPRAPTGGLSDYFDLLNEVREAVADFERDPDKAIEILHRVVDALPTAIRALVSRETVSDETLDEVHGLLNDALDFLSALPSEAFSAGLDALQLSLDVVGLIPGLGEPFDAVNLAISAARQDFVDVGLGIISLVPVLGITACSRIQLPGGPSRLTPTSCGSAVALPEGRIANEISGFDRKSKDASCVDDRLPPVARDRGLSACFGRPAGR